MIITMMAGTGTLSSVSFVPGTEEIET